MRDIDAIDGVTCGFEQKPRRGMTLMNIVCVVVIDTSLLH